MHIFSLIVRKHHHASFVHMPQEQTNQFMKIAVLSIFKQRADCIILIVRRIDADFIYSYQFPGEISSFNGKIKINTK